MSEKKKIQHIAVGAFIATGLSSIASSVTAGDEIFNFKDVTTMQPCYWLSREIPAEGLCGEKMRPDINVLIKYAKNGNNIAAMRLGQLYSSGNWGIEKDLKESVKWYQHAAELGNRHSQLRLGLAYEHGRMEVKKNLDLSIKYYRMANDNGIYPDIEEKIERLERMSSVQKIK